MSSKHYSWWSQENLTHELYLNTYRDDWFAIARMLASALEGGRELLDIGTGDGHTTEQLLSRLKGRYICDLVDPDARGLQIAMQRLKGFPIRDTRAMTITNYLATTDRKWDRMLAVHSNYYWTRTAAQTKILLGHMADKLSPQGRIIIATEPMNGDYYKIAGRNAFHEGVLPGFIASHFVERGMQVSVTPMRQLFYVGEALENDAAARRLFTFFGENRKEPNKQAVLAFQKRLRDTAKGEYIDFQDRIIVATKPPQQPL